MRPPVDWLLEGDPFIAYRTRIDLLGQDEHQLEVRAARSGMMADPRVVNLVRGLAGWPGEVLASHKSASQPFHRLAFLADLGLTADDEGVADIAAAVLARTSEEGPFQLPMRIGPGHGGDGAVAWAWALCDAPLVVDAMARLGWRDHPAVRAAAAHLHALARDDGWPCGVAKELGDWRGPGRRADPCPFANLAMLKALAGFDDLRGGPAVRAGADTLLGLWADSRTRHPYMFYMGTDFRKPKAPFVWYDLLHVLDVLSRFSWLEGDARLHDMLAALTAQADDEGRYTARSVWTAWRDWEFGQKTAPSRWITLLAWRIVGRLEGCRGAARGHPRSVERQGSPNSA